MAVRTAKAVWNGDLQKGQGSIALGSGAFEGQYSFSSRFEDGVGTNPEELVGAAHAGCFSMALTATLGRNGFNPTRVQTEAKVHLIKNDTGFVISAIDLETEAEISGIENDKFQELAETAKQTCPISRALTGVTIKLNAKLV